MGPCSVAYLISGWTMVINHLWSLSSSIRCCAPAHLFTVDYLGWWFGHSSAGSTICGFGWSNRCCIDCSSWRHVLLRPPVEYAGEKNWTGLPVPWIWCCRMSASTICGACWSTCLARWLFIACCWPVSALRHCLQPIHVFEQWIEWAYWQSLSSVPTDVVLYLSQQKVGSSGAVAVAWISGTVDCVLWFIWWSQRLQYITASDWSRLIHSPQETTSYGTLWF